MKFSTIITIIASVAVGSANASVNVSSGPVFVCVAAGCWHRHDLLLLCVCVWGIGIPATPPALLLLHPGDDMLLQYYFLRSTADGVSSSTHDDRRLFSQLYLQDFLTWKTHLLLFSTLTPPSTYRRPSSVALSTKNWPLPLKTPCLVTNRVLRN